MWRTRAPTVNTCALGERSSADGEDLGSCADGEGLDLGREETGPAWRERDCSARMSAGVMSGAASGVASKREGEVGRGEGLRERVRRRSARLGMSSGIVRISVVLRGGRE